MTKNTNIHKGLIKTSMEERNDIENKYKQSDFLQINPELLQAVREGNHNAYNKLYLQCIDPMINFLNLLLHSISDAEELCQQIFVKTWENREMIDPQANFKGYLYKMAKSAAFKHMAHKKVKSKYIDHKLSEAPDFENSPDEVVMSKEMALLIEISLDNMPEQRRRVFEMSRIDGIPNEEIAKKLNISKNTVRAHIYNATKELKELIILFTFFFLSK